MIPAFCLYMGILIPFSLYSYFLAQYALLWVFEYFPANCPFVLVNRFVNNCTDHVGCGFECAGLKTQA